MIIMLLFVVLLNNVSSVNNLVLKFASNYYGFMAKSMIKKNEEITLIDHILKLLDDTSGSIILWHDRAIACSVRRYAKGQDRDAWRKLLASRAYASQV